VSTVSAVILSCDVEALRSVSMLAGSDHAHWDNLPYTTNLFLILNRKKEDTVNTKKK